MMHVRRTFSAVLAVIFLSWSSLPLWAVDTVKTIGGTAIANVKTVGATTKANVKTVNGVALSAGTSYVTSVESVSVTIASGATTGTATLTRSVDTTKAVIFWGGESSTEASTSQRLSFARVTLTDTSTVTATRDQNLSTGAVTVNCAVVEFTAAAIQSVQYGTVTVAASASTGTATVSSVTTGNAVPIYLGRTTNSASDTSRGNVRIALTAATTITATQGGANSGATTSTTSFCLVEFKAAVLQSIQSAQLSTASGNTSDTVTISSVTTGNTLLISGGATSSTSSAVADIAYWQTLTNGTTITFTRSGTSTTPTRTVNVTVLEFASGVMATSPAVQRGSIAVNSATSNTATITATTWSATPASSKAFAIRTGFSSDAAVTTQDTILVRDTLTNATTVTATKGSNGATATTLGYEVANFQ